MYCVNVIDFKAVRTVQAFCFIFFRLVEEDRSADPEKPVVLFGG